MSVIIATPNGMLVFEVLDSDHDPELEGVTTPDEVVDWAEALLDA